MTVSMWVATVAWLLISAGYVLRHRRSIHVTLMNAGIFLDIFLVLYLQVTREAIQTALSFSMEILAQVHIWTSTVALLLYFPVLFLGWKMLRTGDLARRDTHIAFGMWAYFFRTLGFCFMFSMWQ